MKILIRCVTPPTFEPITLEMARLHTRAEAAEDDALLTALISAARQQAEAVTQRIIMPSEWEITLNDLKKPFRIPLTPCSRLLSVTVEDQVLADYAPVPLVAEDSVPNPDENPLFEFVPSAQLLGETPLYASFAPLKDFPQGTIILRVACGYDEVPEAIKQWILVRIGTLYEQRESFAVGANFNEFSRSFVDSLLDPYSLTKEF